MPLLFQKGVFDEDSGDRTRDKKGEKAKEGKAAKSKENKGYPI